ncbi:hypothetical protein FRC05_001288 [Tulasnella sp. 425]|nr:hypothetical protein FRC05_001288 [Tulasnella sp. 425]
MAAPPPSYSSAPIVAPPYAAPPVGGGSDALPGYNDPSAPPSIFIPSQGIDDKLPNHFKIKDQYVQAQVTPSNLQAHLVLLGAFHRLREEVRTFKGKADIPMEPDERWAVFLQRAVYRFEQWAVRMIGGEGQEEALGEGPKVLTPDEVPPLDVVMVWHTYMLNPRNYYEDCLRKLPGLLRVGLLESGKFYEDMEKCIVNPDGFFLANTILDYQAGVPAETQWSQILTATVLSLRETTVPAPAEIRGKQIGWSMKAVEDYTRIGMLGKMNQRWVTTPRPLNVILSAYRQPGPFSLDLASAVLRQMNFIEKMVSLGFTEQARWEEDRDTLTRCVVRYHHFLDLMASTPGNFVVPTLDIDLAWHTHQLLCDSYRKLKDVIGIIPDHDDKVGQGALSDAYDKTAEAWKARFGVPYSVCGCLPSDTSSGSRGSGFSLFSKKGKSKSTLEKPAENPRPDLLSPSDEAAEQTHPSDHDAVAIINPGGPNAAQAQLRRRELTKRAKELGKSVEKGKADQWGEIMQKRGVDHTPSFLCPVQYGVHQGDCTNLSGSGLQSASTSGECCKGNGMSGLCGAHFDHKRGGPLESVKFSEMMRGDSTYMRNMGLAQWGASWGVMGAGGGGGS